MADLSEFEGIDEKEALRKIAERLSKQLKEAKGRNKELVEAVHLAAREAALMVSRPEVIAPKVDKRKPKGEVAFLHLSDWQTGKRTVSYSSDIAATRVGKLIQKVLKITDIQRADHPIRKCVIAFTGDMVEGVSIFPGQPFEVDATLYEQLFFTANLMESVVRTMAANFEEVEVFTEYGNHGRIGRKGELPAQDNVDLMGYRITANATSDLKNVTWNISTNWYNMAVVGNYSALLVHGDEVKSFGGGTPAFGILRKVSAWATGVVPGQWADCYMGHWHQPLVLPIPRGGRVFVSPSTESDNEYAREFVAATGRPGQRLNFIDPVVGQVTSEHLIWLD